MSTDVKIPTLGESITSGILAAWHVKNGDYVETGQPLYDLETDKITSEGAAEVSGTIELKADEGDEVEIGSVVAVIDESASKPESDKVETPEPTSGEASVEDEKQRPPSGQHPPSVRRLAAESGIEPESVSGTGKGGRVTKGDMLQAIEGKEAGKPGSGTEAPATPPAISRTTRKKMSPLRRTIAKRLVEAQQTTAMLTTFNEVDMSAVMNYRKTHQEAFVKRHGVKLGFMSFFVKAAVHALKQVPAINAQVDGDEIVTNNYYDIGVAVSTPKGLMVPVVRDCETKSFATIEQDIIGYANKAKDGKITIDDLQGGVFTISNGGIFGSMLSTPILNTPQSGILGMHTIQDRPMAVNGEVVIRPMMYLALSYDHRLVDGREAVTFLVALKQAIEDPARLLFEI
ncbi:MAG: 2-oxoglutarate dehydrogenase complex dihydrolipoyllysine-residue succinyltransferase [Puniceicoccaceae bacterium]